MPDFTKTLGHKLDEICRNNQPVPKEQRIERRKELMESISVVAERAATLGESWIALVLLQLVAGIEVNQEDRICNCLADFVNKDIELINRSRQHGFN